MIKKLLTYTFIIECIFCTKAHATEIGAWNNYMAYYEIQQIKAAGNDIFVLASNNLYMYNTNDGSITTYDKIKGLNDNNIRHIAWNSSVKKLIAVYANCNIDMIRTNGEITNRSDFFKKAMNADKTVNSITIHDRYAYLATKFGIVKVNMYNEEISESYNLQRDTRKVAVSGNSIYAMTSGNIVLTASVSDNLIDKNKWTQTSNYPQGIFDEDNTDYEKYYPIVSTLNPGGPHYNTIGFLRFTGDKLYTANGLSATEGKASLQIYDGKDWTVYENDITGQTGHRFVNLISCDVDPKDENHVFAGGQTGLYEFRNGKFIKEYNIDNSPLKNATTVDYGNKNYVIVPTVKFDADGHLWLANSISPSTSLFEITPEGEWISHHDKRLMTEVPTKNGKVLSSFESMNGLMFDSRGLMWFSNNYFRTPALMKYSPSDKNLYVYKKEFTNQDGKKLTLSFIKEPTEDKDGNIWMGTNIGPVYITPSQTTSNEDITVLNQYKVPRNDGTNLADYLLSNVEISSIAIDGANRKWFGTKGNGVYLISSDNEKQIHHFTKDNSKLLSDNVMDIAINDKGEVFFGTDQGLCSYMGDATEPAEDMDKNSVYAYPNPVRPEYDGLITVSGLTADADVKITTATGYLVAQGKSNGGTFTWNGRDLKGRKVASGVYHVVTAKSDGSKGTVCNVAIIR